jgi:hypothetical protein
MEAARRRHGDSMTYVRRLIYHGTVLAAIRDHRRCELASSSESELVICEQPLTVIR